MPRQRKPKSSHERDGTYQKCRHGAGGLPVAVPGMPQDMPASVEAVWKSVVGQLERAGIVSEPDGLILRRMCELCWVATEAFDDLQTTGLTMRLTNKGGHTNTVANPNLRAYLAAVKELTAIAHKYGMTPTGRLGMNFEEPEDESAEDIIGFKVA